MKEERKSNRLEDEVLESVDGGQITTGMPLYRSMDQLIADPLTAAHEAPKQLKDTTDDFIRNVGFAADDKK